MYLSKIYISYHVAIFSKAICEKFDKAALIVDQCELKLHLSNFSVKA